MKMTKKTLMPLAFLFVALLIPAFVSNAYVINLFTMTLLYAFMASGWNIIGGYGGQVALGNGLYVGLGAYITASLFVSLNVTPWIGLLIAGVIVGLISVLIGSAIFNLSGSYYGVSTVALLNMTRILFNQAYDMFGLHMGGPMGLKVTWYGTALAMQFLDKRYYYYLVLALLILVLLLSNAIRKSKFGYYLLAINTNPMAAGSLGVNNMLYKECAQFISTFILAIGGGIYAFIVMYLDPITMFGPALAFNIMLMAVVGGKGTVWGPVIGACILIPIREVLSMQFGTTLPGLPQVVFALTLITCMQFFPKGIVPLLERFLANRKNGGGNKREKEVTDVA